MTSRAPRCLPRSYVDEDEVHLEKEVVELVRESGREEEREKETEGEREEAGEGERGGGEKEEQ